MASKLGASQAASDSPTEQNVRVEYEDAFQARTTSNQKVTSSSAQKKRGEQDPEVDTAAAAHSSRGGGQNPSTKQGPSETL